MTADAERTVEECIRWALTVNPRLWATGDGDGGTVLDIVRSVAGELGLRPGPQPSSRKDHPNRRPISPSKRLAVYAGNDYKCVSCGTGSDLQVDHIHPVSRGGTNDLSNLQTMCGPCNREKGAT